MRHRGVWREQALAEGARPRLGDFSRDGRQLTARPAFSRVPPCRLASAKGAVGAPSTLLGDEWLLTEVPGQLTGTRTPGPVARCVPPTGTCQNRQWPPETRPPGSAHG